MKTILKNATIYKNGKFIKDADVLINGKNIEKICKNIIVSDENIVLCDKKYVLPAFVNCCVKNDKNHKKQAKNGVSTIILINNDIEDGKKYLEIGYDVYFAIGVFLPNEVLDLNELENRYNLVKHAGLKPILYAYNSYFVEENVFFDLLQFSKQHGDIPFVICSNNTLNEVGECDKQYGVTPIGLLDEYALLNDRSLVAGCEVCDKEDVDLLNYKDAFVCVTPTESLRAGNGIAPLYSLMKNGVPVCLGGMDFLKEISLSADLQAGVLNQPGVVSLDDLVGFASINPNRFLERNAGAIDENSLADLVVLDTPDLLNATTDNVCYTFSKGKLIYKK